MFICAERLILERIEILRDQEQEQFETIEQVATLLREGRILTAERILLSLPMVCKTEELEKDSTELWRILDLVKREKTSQFTIALESFCKRIASQKSQIKFSTDSNFLQKTGGKDSSIKINISHFKNTNLKSNKMKHGLLSKANENYKINCMLQYRYNKFKEKCYNPNCADYKYYGARGIRVCDEWLTSFHTFYTWAIVGFREGLTIDRIDNNGHYCPENCRWVDRKVQSNNRRNNVVAFINGEELTGSQIAEKYGLNDSTVRWRIKKGWSSEEIILPPGSKR
jgi:hypothetical protein